MQMDNLYTPAQTIVQLLQQLEHDGYERSEIQQVADAYRAMVWLSGARYRPSGKPFVDHLVGVASICARHRHDVPVMIAGLAHSIYREADFGSFWPRPGRRQQRMVRRRIGSEAEELVRAFSDTRWSQQSIQHMLGRAESLSSLERDVIYLRIANEMEEAVGLDLLYYAEQRRYEKEALLADCVDLANLLSLPALAQEVAETHRILSEIPHPGYLVVRKAYSFDIHQRSYRKRLLPVIGKTLYNIKKRFTQK
jgi:(p)ppGpp synthase/HD superfamily hydrolase